MRRKVHSAPDSDEDRSVNRGPEKHGARDQAERDRRVERYIDVVIDHGVVESERDEPCPCPCRGYLTLTARGDHEICDVRFREDDGQDEHDADIVRGGPNGGLSLTQARRNVAEFGACDRSTPRHVRDPPPQEHPAEGGR
ncbi:hypothetical protein EIO00_10465 [Thermomonospora catenispora]|nr:hypothetical protein EIO00_10465 [Thermomonospora catenispora]